MNRNLKVGLVFFSIVLITIFVIIIVANSDGEKVKARPTYTPFRRRILVTESVAESTKEREILISSTSTKTEPASSKEEASTIYAEKTTTISIINKWPLTTAEKPACHADRDCDKTFICRNEKCTCDIGFYISANNLENSYSRLKSDFFQQCVECPYEWNTFYNFCYKFMPNKHTFDDATEDCNKYGGELLNLKNRYEWEFYNNFAKSQSTIESVWIGLKAEYVADHRRPDGSELFINGSEWCQESNGLSKIKYMRKFQHSTPPTSSDIACLENRRECGFLLSATFCSDQRQYICVKYLDEKAMCESLSYWDGTSCKPKKGLFENCDRSIECSNSYQCVNSICTCPFGKYLNKNDECIDTNLIAEHRYFFNEKPLRYEDAKAYCQKFGMKIALINGNHELKALVHYLNIDDGWHGQQVWVQTVNTKKVNTDRRFIKGAENQTGKCTVTAEGIARKDYSSWYSGVLDKGDCDLELPSICEDKAQYQDFSKYGFEFLIVNKTLYISPRIP